MCLFGGARKGGQRNDSGDNSLSNKVVKGTEHNRILLFSVGPLHHQAAETLVNKLKSELGESTMRNDALKKTLAQKELQLLDLQEQQGALRLERDGLRGALQQLKSQHSSALKEAQEKTQKIMVTQIYKVNYRKVLPRMWS